LPEGETAPESRAAQGCARSDPRKASFHRASRESRSSAFFPGPMDRAAFVTMDGVVEWSTAAFGTGARNGLSFLRQMRFPHSLCLPYSAFTWDCGFKDEHAESGNPLFPLPPGRSCDFLTAFASKAFPGNVPMRKLKMTKPVLFALPASCEPIERNDCLRVNHPAHRSAM